MVKHSNKVAKRPVRDPHPVANLKFVPYLNKSIIVYLALDEPDNRIIDSSRHPAETDHAVYSSRVRYFMQKFGSIKASEGVMGKHWPCYKRHPAGKVIKPTTS